MMFYHSNENTLGHQDYNIHFLFCLKKKEYKIEIYCKATKDKERL